MALTLESAMVIPLSIGMISLSLRFAAPLYHQVHQAGRLEVLASCERIAGDRLYRADCIRVGDVWTTGLQTSPQQVLELASLARDDVRLISRIFPGLHDGGGRQIPSDGAQAGGGQEFS